MTSAGHVFTLQPLLALQLREIMLNAFILFLPIVLLLAVIVTFLHGTRYNAVFWD